MIMIIDDEKHIRRLIGDYLRNEGFEVVEAKDGYDGLDKLKLYKNIDLVLLDIRMPKLDGFETLEALRDITDVPVIFLTAQDDIKSEVKGLKAGAYDYITKPFSYEILIARVSSCLAKVTERKPDFIKIENMTINLSNRIVLIDDEDVRVTQREFDVLELLIKNKNMALERSIILDRIWGYDFYGDPRTVDTHIKTLRAKLKSYGELIKTIRGVGYYFELD